MLALGFSANTISLLALVLAIGIVVDDAIVVVEAVEHILEIEPQLTPAEAAEKAMAQPDSLHLSKNHLALTERAFERTPAARLGNAPITQAQLSTYRQWQADPERHVFDRSLLLLLGMR